MGQKGEKKNRSWNRKLGLERLLLPEYQRDDGGLNVKLCSPRSSRANQDQGPGNVCELLVPSSLEFMCWQWTDPFYTQRPARGRRYQAVDGCDRTGGLANHVSASRRGFFPCNLTHFQIQILSKQLRGNRTSFTREPPVQRHLTGSAPGLVFFFSLFRRL